MPSTPPTMNEFEAEREANVARNKVLLEQLDLNVKKESSPQTSERSVKKKQRLEAPPPTRSSARISAIEKPICVEADNTKLPRKNVSKNKPSAIVSTQAEEKPPSISSFDKSSILEKWKWEATARAPTRDDDGTLHFEDFPELTPNKTPEEILREGCFGGSYFRPLYSQTLGFTVTNDHLELPAAWTTNLQIERYLTSSTYDPTVNKYGVACGQTIEQWEAAGWINHHHDVRGWFQWYIRFYLGRRCDDDERQVSRWKKCVGSTGRWRRVLLKKYVVMGIRNVFDDGDEEGKEGKEVSPVVHQTCHHWGFEVRQEALDEFWRTGM